MRDPEPRQPLTVGRQHDDLVLGACQVQADDHIITPEAASIVRHVGPSFVSGQTREGITRTGRRCRLPLSHTLILDNGRELLDFVLAVEAAGFAIATSGRGVPSRTARWNAAIESTRRNSGGRHRFTDFEEAATALRVWKRVYNYERFSLALQGRTPAEKVAGVLPSAAA